MTFGSNVKNNRNSNWKILGLLHLIQEKKEVAHIVLRNAWVGLNDLQNQFVEIAKAENALAGSHSNKKWVCPDGHLICL